MQLAAEKERKNEAEKNKKKSIYMCTFVEHESEIKTALSGLLEKSISLNILLCLKADIAGRRFDEEAVKSEQHAKNYW